MGLPDEGERKNTKEKKEMKATMKELIYKIIHEENWEKAQGMLEMLNLIYGTQFGFLNKRVVRFENPNGSVAERYAHCHDAWAEMS